MSFYKKPDTTLWTGRTSDNQLYVHEKIQCIDLEKQNIPKAIQKSFAILGYQCDEGVDRNKGRIGAINGPNAIRKMMASLSNHFSEGVTIIDTGNIICENNDLEKTQEVCAEKVLQLQKHQYFTLLLGGGHDIAYAHYNGLKKAIPNNTIGIINLDAHFDLRKMIDKPNSGTPFYQIAKENRHFSYLCLGIQKESNNKELFTTAHELGVQYILNTDFNLQNTKYITSILNAFIASVDTIYLTIDMDGFSSPYAPGVSAPSPFGFSPDIVLEVIRHICNSDKLISVDVAELNPIYDIDSATARLAARLIYYIITYIDNNTIYA